VITRLDFASVPSTDLDRSRAFYVETLGLRPTDYGMEFEPQRLAPLALHVDDVEAAKAELTGKGVEFNGDTIDTGVCHMAFFVDPDRNQLILHNRYAPHE
jgi:catechol 2,3-dioxygenase-like lactoylglutathione lyase family enzyme